MKVEDRFRAFASGRIGLQAFLDLELDVTLDDDGTLTLQRDGAITQYYPDGQLKFHCPSNVRICE